MQKLILIAVLAGVQITAAFAQAPAAAPPVFVLQPERVFDGESSHAGWIVVVRGERIEAAGPTASITVPAGARTIVLKGATLMPGMIEGHSHLLLHPYNETAWNDQVLREPLALRVARGGNHAREHDGRHHHRSRPGQEGAATRRRTRQRSMKGSSQAAELGRPAMVVPAAIAERGSL